MSMNVFRALGATVLFGLAPSWAIAQSFDSVRLVAARPGSTGGMYGAAVVAGPHYPGSDESRARIYPALDLQWANGAFAGTSNGVGYNFSRMPWMAWGGRITWAFGRDAKDSRALAGMGDLGFRPEAGLFFNLSPQRWLTVTSSLRVGGGQSRNGVVVDTGVGVGMPITPVWRVGASVGLSWANGGWRNSHFGVTPTQAAQSGYPVWTPGSGLRESKLGFSMVYGVLPPTGFLTAVVSVSHLHGDAAASPLVRRRTGVSGVLAFTQAFSF